MTPDEAIFACLGECQVLFPDFAARDGDTVRVIVQAFRRELHEYPAEVIRDAFRQHIRTSRTFPLLADIIARCEKSTPAEALGDRFEKRVRRLRQCGMTHLLTPDEEARAIAAGLIEGKTGCVIRPDQWQEIRRAIALPEKPSRGLTRRRAPVTVAAPNGHFHGDDDDE